MSEQVQPKTRSPLFYILLIFVLLVLLILTAGATYYFFVAGAGTANANGHAQQGPMEKYNMEPFTVNLLDSNFRRYVRLSLTLEFDDKKLAKELEAKEHRIRDGVISHIMNKRASDLADQEALRQELLKVINNSLTSGQVRGLYFEDFIIQ